MRPAQRGVRACRGGRATHRIKDNARRASGRWGVSFACKSRTAAQSPRDMPAAAATKGPFLLASRQRTRTNDRLHSRKHPATPPAHTPHAAAAAAAAAMRALPLLLLLALAAAASAARVAPETMPLAEELPPLPWRANDAALQAWLADAGKGKGDKQGAYVAFRYYVAPGKAKDFLDAWGQLEKATADEKGLRVFGLMRALSNNVAFVGYGEWESTKDYMQHYDSEHVQAFLDALAKHDIPYAIEPLEKPDVPELTPQPSAGGKGGKGKAPLAHALVRYWVPPSAADAFMDAWAQAEKGTEGEKGARSYTLRRLALDNHHFYSYGSWDKMQDFHAHFESDHVKQLMADLDKHGIVWFLSPLHKEGSQPE